MVDVYAIESVKTVTKYLPLVVNDLCDLEARSEVAFAADILSGYTMVLASVTSHHILAQTLGGFFSNLPHGASLIVVCEAYYKKVCAYLPQEFDELGMVMGEDVDPLRPGYAFVKALIKLMEKTGCRDLAMSSFGIQREDFSRIVDMTVDEVGIDLDRYTLTKKDMYQILEDSYK
jgi:alcohol dehydrogenase